MVRAMAYQTTIRGGMTNTHGSCPGCGAEVKRVHAWSDGRARESYDCPRCGTFEYTTAGAELPESGPVSFGSPSGLNAVLDPADCIQ